MKTKERLLKFSHSLSHIGHLWVFVEIVKGLLEVAELLSESAGHIENFHELLVLTVLIVSEAMSIFLVHLIFEFASLHLEGMAAQIKD